MNINIIAAIGKNNELGKDNDLIWKIKGDLKFFKDITMNHPIVMGRKTFESLPKVLPGRSNIVISSSGIISEKIELYKSIKDFLLKYNDYDQEIFIIGGATIYKQFIELASKLYLTEIDDQCLDADVFFPVFDKNNYNKKILSENIENGISYKHVLYKKK